MCKVCVDRATPTRSRVSACVRERVRPAIDCPSSGLLQANRFFFFFDKSLHACWWNIKCFSIKPAATYVQVNTRVPPTININGRKLWRVKCGGDLQWRDETRPIPTPLANRAPRVSAVASGFHQHAADPLRKPERNTTLTIERNEPVCVCVCGKMHHTLPIGIFANP